MMKNDKCDNCKGCNTKAVSPQEADAKLKLARKMEFYKRHPKLIKLWFWLTCWRPITKYEHAKLTQNLIGYSNMINLELRDIKINMNHIVASLNQKGLLNTKDDSNNVDRGMFQ